MPALKARYKQCSRCKNRNHPVQEGLKTCDSCRASKAAYQRTDKGRQVYNASKSKWRKTPHGHELAFAHAYVAIAVKRGTLVRQPCEVCGEVKVQGHHDDYSPEKRLDVRWLCIDHHKEVHRGTVG